MRLGHHWRHLTRWRLYLSVLLGLIVVLVTPSIWTPVTRALTGWNAGLYLYLALVFQLFLSTDGADLPELARRNDDKALLILMAVCLAAVASLLAIAFELAAPTGAVAASASSSPDSGAGTPWVHRVLAVSTIVGSWALLPTVFTLHYAHLYHTSDHGLLKFPESPQQPDYLDFAYFAFTIAVASQTADVAVTSSAGRRLVLLQSVLAFVFNASLVALTVNIGAGLVQ